MQFYSDQPPRRALISSPQQRCIIRGGRIVISPGANNWGWIQWGTAVRVAHENCPVDDDESNNKC